VAIVTGAARGIGRACAVALASSGFDLVLADLAEHADGPLREVENETAALGGGVLAVGIDVAHLDEHPRLIAAAVDRWGRLDCLVNNAGVGVIRRGDLLDVTPESFDRCIDVNTRAVFFLSQAAARHMLTQGEVGLQHRSIINITSSNVVAVSVTRGEYCVSKCASSMTTRVFAVRLAEAGIGVYEVRPGIIETEMTLPVKERYDRLIADGLVPAKRWGYPADVASTVRSMAEGKLAYTVGQPVTIDGGLTIPRF
jgi:NAD(P)-dependent dehydrogenase (short-subunit alcohol dehydrogenase family)